MKQSLFFLVILALCFQSCTKDNDFAAEIENAEYVAPEDDGTQLKGEVGEEVDLTEVLPEYIANKISNGEELSMEEKMISDQVHYENIIYNGQERSVEAAYTDNALMNVYFDDATATLVMDKNIYLFDTEEDRENFVNSQLDSRDTGDKRFNMRVKLWEHENFSGASLYYWANDIKIGRAAYLLPGNWTARVSSIKLWDTKILNAGGPYQLRFSMLRNNDARNITYSISGSGYMQFSNLRNLYPIDDVYQWNADYNDHVYAFAVFVNKFQTPSDALTGAEFWTLGGFVQALLDIGIGQFVAKLEFVVTEIITGGGASNQGLPSTVPHQITITMPNHGYLKVRDEPDMNAYSEGIPYWSNRNQWYATNVIENGKPIPSYILTNTVTHKVLENFSSNHVGVAWHHGNNIRQQWAFIKYEGSWFTSDRYKIVNVASGRVLTSVGIDAQALPNNTSNSSNQLWWIRD